ncbi:MAG: response regulator, partial [Desulfobacterales bacterium]|nr:response regulator [Desulfobacterales bacterium]
EYVDMLSVSSEILLSLIEDVLDFSKIEAGKIELEHVDFNLKTMISKLADMMKIKASEKGLILDFAISSDVPVFVKGDVTRLRQVLLNLLNNAVKFTEKGKIDIRVRVDSENYPDDNLPDDNLKDNLNTLNNSNKLNNLNKGLLEQQLTAISFEVIDTGIGIPKERLDRMFKPFSQTDASTTRKYGGTGLGLVISKKLVEIMGGQISVQSEYGKGSNFKFTVQLEQGEEFKETDSKYMIDDKKVLTDKLQLSTLNVLMAEDNEFNQRLALIVLKQMGIYADVVQNGREAVDAVEKKQYDIILMDIQMPEMDGIQAAKLIRSKNINIPVIAMTANVTPEDRRACLAAGMNEYISKPVDPEKLRKVILKLSEKLDSSIVENNNINPVKFVNPMKAVNSANPIFQNNKLIKVFDKEEFLDRVSGNSAIMEQLLKIISQSLPNHIKILEELVNKGAVKEIVKQAHSVKGVTANCSANRLSDSLYKIELAAKSEDIEKVKILMNDIDRECKEFLSVISDI